MKVGDTVHIDTDNEEWGRVASDGTVLEIGERDALVNAASIRANILVPLSDISETGGGGPGEADAAMRDMDLGRIAAGLLRGAAAYSELEVVRRAKQAVERGGEWAECGSCGRWHPADWHGDCRDDEMRLPLDPQSVLDSATAEELAAIAPRPDQSWMPPRPTFRRGPLGPAGWATGIGRIAARLRAGADGRRTPSEVDGATAEELAAIGSPADEDRPDRYDPAFWPWRQDPPGRSRGFSAASAGLAAGDVLRLVYRALRAAKVYLGRDTEYAANGIVGVEMGAGADGQAQIALTTGIGEGMQTWILDAESILEADMDSAVDLNGPDPATIWKRHRGLSDMSEGSAPREPGL